MARTQQQKRKDFHDLIDKIFDHGEVFDWAGMMFLGKKKSKKPNTGLLIFGAETTQDTIVKLLHMGALNAETRPFPEVAKPGTAYHWENTDEVAWDQLVEGK